MPEDEQGQGQGTPTGEGTALGGEGTGSGTGSQGQDQGADDKSAGKKKSGTDEALKDPVVQAEIERRVTIAVRTNMEKEELKRQQAISDALDKARHEAEEAKLLEDGKTQELYDLERQKREELEAKLLKLERDEKIAALLDKKDIFDDRVRNLFIHHGGELTDLAVQMDKLLEVVEEQVTSKVNEKLKTSPPPPSGKEPENKEKGTLEEQLDKAGKEAAKTGDWTTYLNIANQIQDRASKFAASTSRTPVSTPGA